MNLSRHDIETLILSDIFNMINEEESQLLEKLLEGDPSIRKLQQEIRKTVEGPVRDYLKEQPTADWAQQALKIAKKQERKIQVSTWIAGVAAMLIIGLLLLKIYYPGRSNLESVALQRNLTPAKNVLLRLPNGETIALDSSSQQFRSKSIDLVTNNNSLHYHSIAEPSPGSASILVPAGKDYKIFLSDGSEIHLNSESELTFPLTFSGNKREIIINGEAYLKVAKKASQPLIVHLPNGTIEVLGTSFNVNTYDTDIYKIALVEGSLKVNTENSNIILKPGEEAVTSKNGLKIIRFDASVTLAWQEGKYYIETQTLTDLTATISRWYGITVVIDSENASKQRFSGILRRDQPIEDFLKGIKITNAIQYEKDTHGVYHIR
ncbi:FecR family protein [Chitinophaga ginsengisoli]|uniref:FecR family protein n=1 Tax=Chitinophaga ginsengisoli TaxID=363837 RepID=A0A2P8GQ80_9BACT|nr:FecR domain-containing protein [Chitinophaga ginsengisoli]PSL36104.1 FecR family protein [Chitinophaga ginsengisoli]